MKLKYIQIIFIVFLFFSFTHKQYSTDFSGEWEVETTHVTFSVYLNQSNNHLTGRHCSIQNDGNKIDCVIDESESINGTIENQTYVMVKFDSQFSAKSGTAKITKLDSNTIEWQIIKKPKGEFYIPNRIILKKEKS